MKTLSPDQQQQKNDLIQCVQDASAQYNQAVDNYLVAVSPEHNSLYAPIWKALAILNEEIKTVNLQIQKHHNPLQEAQVQLETAIEYLQKFTTEVFEEIDLSIGTQVELSGGVPPTPEMQEWCEKWAADFAAPNMINLPVLAPFRKADVLSQMGEPLEVALTDVQKFELGVLDLPDSPTKS